MTSVTTPGDDMSAVEAPRELPVRAGEEAWTPEEIEEIRAELQGEFARIAAEVQVSEAELMELMNNHGEGAGDDSADAGGKVLEREQELTRARHSQAMFEQTQRALERLADGSYGVCEQCGEPVGKYRLQAFPRATQCVACKQKSERR